MNTEQKKNLSLEDRMADLEGSVQALYRLHLLSPSKEPRNDEKLMGDWARLQDIGAKKEWDEIDTASTVQFAWYLTQDELRRLERLTGIKLCWLPLFRLLDLMRIRLVAMEDFEGDFALHMEEAKIRGAISNLEKATVVYLLRYAPELHDAIQEHIHAYTDELTPDFSPAAAP